MNVSSTDGCLRWIPRAAGREQKEHRCGRTGSPRSAGRSRRRFWTSRCQPRDFVDECFPASVEVALRAQLEQDVGPLVNSTRKLCDREAEKIQVAADASVARWVQDSARSPIPRWHVGEAKRNETALSLFGELLEVNAVWGDDATALELLSVTESIANSKSGGTMPSAMPNIGGAVSERLALWEQEWREAWSSSCLWE